MIEGSYDLNGRRMHSYNRIVIATGAPPANQRYLVQFTVTGYAEKAQPKRRPDIEAVITGSTSRSPKYAAEVPRARRSSAMSGVDRRRSAFVRRTHRDRHRRQQRPRRGHRARTGPRRGQVILAVRNTAKGDEAAAGMTGDVEVRKLDLQDLASVRAFADGVDGVDVLVNNAGIMAVPYAQTVDGFESQIGTNHLGHFALTNLLLPKITDRVVTVSSMMHLLG